MSKETDKKSSGPTPNKRKKVLGRGLDALIPVIEEDEKSAREYIRCDIELIRTNRYQPRMRFSEKELDELSRSIKEQGIIQPLVVRKSDIGYELVAGERRLRAAKMAGFKRVPVVIKDITDTQMLEMSIIENVQRENLNPMEEAEAYNLLMTEFNLTQEQAAQRVGKSRSAIANFLRLRQLPEQIKTSIMDGELSMGHARAILGAESAARQTAIWRSVVSKELSVRETESLVKRLKEKPEKIKEQKVNPEGIYFSHIAGKLSSYYGTKVRIKCNGQRGKVEIDFYSDDDLDRLIGLLQPS